MKFFLILSIALASLSSFAEERSFRILPHTVTDKFAIAWGIPGQKIDFEAIEAQGEESVAKYVEENYEKFQNFIVDLREHKILFTFDHDMIYGSLGDVQLSHNIGIDLEAFSATDYEEVVLVNYSSKWDTGFYNAIALGSRTTSAREIKIKESLSSIMAKFLTPEQVILWERAQIVVEDIYYSPETYSRKAVVSGNQYSCEETCVYVTLTGDVQMTIEEDQVVFNVSNFTFKSEEF